ncbi:MAG: hypothetical protein ACRD8U_13920, partial [Pyrinomonadaceae bacterium]
MKYFLLTLFAIVLLATAAVQSSVIQSNKLVGRFVIYGADHTRPVGYGTVRVKIRVWTFEKKTNSQGWFVLSVPCNTDGVI